jgi:hypothetical protein
MRSQVQFIYSLAILLSVPLQLFPAVRIMENGLFTAGRSGKADARVKWLKNAFRAGVVMLCTLISWAGAADLDKFVALVGSFAWCVCFFFFLAVPLPRRVGLTRDKCTAVLYIPCDAALQGVRAHARGKGRGRGVVGVWRRRDGVYDSPGGVAVLLLQSFFFFF